MGELDLAVLPMPVKDHRVSVEPLFTEPLLLVTSKDHPLANQKSTNIPDLADETFVSLGDTSALAAQTQVFFGDHNFEPKIGYRCAQVATLKLIVSMGLGIAILPRLARQASDSDSLTYLRIAGTEPTRELAIVRHLQRYQSRGAEQFIGMLREEAAGMGKPNPR